MKNKKLITKKKLTRISFFLAILILITSQIGFNDTLPLIEQKKIDIKSSSEIDTYDYYVGPIEINATLSFNTSNSGNWTWAIDTFDWCTGSGALGDPYVIDGVFFDGNETENGLTILDSTDYYFEIKNCKGNSSIWDILPLQPWLPGEYKAGIYIESSSKGIIYNNNYSLNGLGIKLLNSTNFTVSGNLILNNIYMGLYLSESSNITVSQNILVNNSNYGIFLSNSKNNSILSNSASYHLRFGIYISEGSDNCIVSSNNAFNNGLAGIVIGSSFNTIILKNLVYNNLEGIRLSNSTKCDVYSNIAFNNSKGIYLRETDKSTILNNSIYQNSISGIGLFIANNTLIGGNFIENNTRFGVIVSISNSTVVLNNVVSHNLNNIFGEFEIVLNISLNIPDNITGIVDVESQFWEINPIAESPEFSAENFTSMYFSIDTNNISLVEFPLYITLKVPKQILDDLDETEIINLFEIVTWDVDNNFWVEENFEIIVGSNGTITLVIDHLSLFAIGISHDEPFDEPLSIPGFPIEILILINLISISSIIINELKKKKRKNY